MWPRGGLAQQGLDRLRTLALVLLTTQAHAADPQLHFYPHAMRAARGVVEYRVHSRCKLVT